MPTLYSPPPDSRWFLLGNELRFLIPYCFLLVHQYEMALLVMVAVLFVNLTAGSSRTLTRELNAGRTPMPPHLHREELT